MVRAQPPALSALIASASGSLVASASTSSYLRPFLAASLLYHGFEQYIRWRRRARLAVKGVPEAVAAAMPEVDPAEYARAQEYSAAKNNFGFVADLYGLATGLVHLWLQAAVWNGPALSLVLRCGGTASHELARAGASMLLCAPWDLLSGVPVDLYRTFVLEERFGFNKHTWLSWLGDSLKHFVVEELLMGSLMMAPLVLLVRSLGAAPPLAARACPRPVTVLPSPPAGPSSWLYGFGFTSLFVLVLNVVYPVWIAPLFNTFAPLPEGDVRDGVEALVKSSGINCSRIFQVDGSRQSAHSNAYVAGFFGSKRIVIYDTLITHLDGDVEDICAVVAHEIGHAQLHHNYALLGVSTAQLFVMFRLFGVCTDPRLVTDFGFDAPCAYLSLLTFFTLWSVAMPLVSFGLNAFTRQLEYQADAYSVRLGFDIRKALAKISKTNLSDLNPDPLDSLFHHSHPTTVQRVLAVKQLLDTCERKAL